MSLIMETLKKTQELRLQELRGTPFFKGPNGKGAQRLTGRKYWVSFLIGGLGILLFISLGGSALLPRLPSQAEQKTAAGEEKKPALQPGKTGEIPTPYPENVPSINIESPSPSPGNGAAFLRAELTPQHPSTPISTQAPVDPGIEGRFPLIAPLREKEKEDPPAVKRTPEKTKARKGELRRKTDGAKKSPVPPVPFPQEAVLSPKSVEIIQAGEKEHSLAREVLTHFNSGVHFSQQRDFARAARAYEKVIELDPNYFEAYNNLAIVYQEMGDWEKARSACQKSVELNPRYEKAHNNLGILLYLQERYEESIEAFEKALAVNPLNIESYINLGILFKKRGQMDKAIESYQKALRINPLNPEAHYNIALLYEQVENLALAIGHYQNFVQLSAKNHSDLVSRVKRHLEDLSRARRELNRGKGSGNG